MFSRKRMLKKFFVLLTIVTILGLNVRPFATAHAESLADVNVLQDVNVNAVLGNATGTSPYTLALKLTGTGLADVELVNPDKTAVFYSKELADKWTPNGKAHVEAELLPISLADIPGVVAALNGVTSTLNDNVNTLLQTVNTIVNENGLTNQVIQVQGLTDLQAALAALNNLDDAVVNLTDYKDDITVTKGDNGEMIVNFSDALGTRLDTAVNDLVLKLLNDVVTAVDGLNIVIDISKLPDALLNNPITDLLNNATGGILGGLLGSGLVGNVVDNVEQLTSQLRIETDDLLDPFTPLLTTVTNLVGQISNGTLDLLDGLASLQVLGTTEVSLNLNVVKPSGLNGDVKVYGAVVNTSVIDLTLLSSLVDYDTINFNETAGGGTTPVTTTPVTTTPTTTPVATTTATTTTTSGSTLPNTSTDMWIYGLTGISTLVAGIGTRRFARRK